jgi:hypothetical protein
VRPTRGYLHHLAGGKRAPIDDYLDHPGHGTESITRKPGGPNTVVPS